MSRARSLSSRHPLWVFFAAAFTWLALVFGSRLAVAQTATIELYTRLGCPHCLQATRYLEGLATHRFDFVVVSHDVASDAAARERLAELSEAAGVVTPGVPTFVIGGEVLVGFDPEMTPPLLQKLLNQVVGHDPAGDEGEPQKPRATGALDLPVFGWIDVEKLGLPLFTIAVGLVDGFNPCATWVLMFLLSMLVNLKSRQRMALIAGTFVMVSGLVYFAFMAAWLTVFMVLGVSQPLRIGLALLALTVGALDVKDFFALGKGPSLSIPESAKPGLYKRIRAVLHADNLTGAMTGIVVLAFVVNLVELLCTAGLPAVYTAVLTAQHLSVFEYYAYLALYICAYMLDDAILVTIGVATLSRRKLQEKGGRWLKLFSGGVIIVLGVLLLVSPEWMGF